MRQVQHVGLVESEGAHAVDLVIEQVIAAVQLPAPARLQ
jgi:hypothetical protein